MITEPTFVVVHAIRVGDNKFTVEGIFSKDEDAEALRAALTASESIMAVPTPQRVPMKIIIDMLLEDRLQDLAKQLADIAAHMASFPLANTDHIRSRATC